MRADRLLAILLQLQANRRLTTRQLAGRLEVSARTIHRDMEALGAAGVPLYAERGARGGWVLPDAYRADLAGLTDAEVQALVVARPPRVLADLGLRQAADAAAVKLLLSLPDLARRRAERIQERILIDAPGWRQLADDVPHLRTLQDALWRDRRIRVAYTRGDGTPSERTLDPLGLIAKGRLWYLIAAVEGRPRTYRVSRIQEATLLDESCERPPGFDLAAFWAESSAGFVIALPRYPAIVRVTPEALPHIDAAGWWVRVEETGDPEPDGRRTLRVTCETEDYACRWALAFGPRLEVLEPPELRARVATEARALAALYTCHVPAGA